MNSKLYLLIIVFFCCNVAIAQKVLNEATLSYEIMVVSPNSPSAKKLLEGSVLNVYIKGEKSRTDVVSNLGTESAIYNSKLAKGAILKEYSGQKLIITLTKENWEDKSRLFRNLKFTIANESKDINGFNCKKAQSTLEDGDKLEVYFATDMALNNNDYNNSFYGLPGIPVQYEIKSGEIVFKYTLKNINYDVVPFSTFEIPKFGYRVLNYEDAMQLRRGS